MLSLPRPPRSSAVRFSIASAAAWAPGMETREAWQAWASNVCSASSITLGSEPALRAMPAMQRRRVGFLGRMALEVAYECLGDRTGVSMVFCSSHGEVSRSVDLLQDLASGEPLSPASFSLSVHNATAGLFSIARGDNANHVALSARQATVEHAVIEACGLLADGEKAVLLVAYDCPLPPAYSAFQNGNEQPYAWAWLIEPPQDASMTLAWSSAPDAILDAEAEPVENLSAGLQVLRFHLRGERSMTRFCDRRKWEWARNA